jgi:ERCC4-type nuclease
MLLDDYIHDKPVVVYDPNEKRAHVIRYLRKFEDVVIVERPLEIADYLVQSSEGTIAIERKKASDFLSSITDGRLFTQIEHLQGYEDARIILEGAIFTKVKMGACFCIDTLGKPFNKRKGARTQPMTTWATRHFIHPHSLTSIFKKIQDSGIAIIPSGSAYDTADLLHFWATKGEKTEQLEIRRKVKTETDYDRQLFIIAGLPGIGAVQATELLKTYGTPMHVFSAFLDHSPRNFPIKGLGEKKVKKISDLLTKNLLEVQRKRMIEHELKERVGELYTLLNAKESELNKMRVDEIKSLLKERNLKVGGKKIELIKRLLDSMDAEEKVDIKRFIDVYDTVKKTKARHHQIPRDLSLFYSKVKR